MEWRHSDWSTPFRGFLPRFPYAALLPYSVRISLYNSAGYGSELVLLTGPPAPPSKAVATVVWSSVSTMDINVTIHYPTDDYGAIVTSYNISGWQGDVVETYLGTKNISPTSSEFDLWGAPQLQKTAVNTGHIRGHTVIYTLIGLPRKAIVLAVSSISKLGQSRSRSSTYGIFFRCMLLRLNLLYCVLQCLYLGLFHLSYPWLWTRAPSTPVYRPQLLTMVLLC